MDIGLDSSFDLDFVNFDLTSLSGVSENEQRVRMLMTTIRGEYNYDIEQGITFERVYGKNFNLSVAEIQLRISELPNFKKFSNLRITVSGRTLSMSGDIIFTDGTVTLEEVF